MLEIGTKVGFLSIASLLILSLIISFIRFIKDKKYFKQFISMLSLVLISIVFLGNTSVGVNLKIKPLVFSNTTSYSSNKSKSKTKKDTETYADKFKENPEIILSGRNSFFKNTKQRYIQSSIKDKLIGIGYINEENESIVESKLVEIDYFDVFFSHGIVGTIIFAIPLFVILLLIIKKLFKNFIANIKNSKIIILLYSVSIAFGIALMAGHVLTSPAVSMFLILDLLLLLIILNKNEELKYE